MSNNEIPPEPITFTFKTTPWDLYSFPRNWAQLGQTSKLQTNVYALSMLVTVITQYSFVLEEERFFEPGGFKHIKSSYFTAAFWVLVLYSFLWIGYEIWRYLDMKNRLLWLGESGDIRQFTADHEGFE